MKLTAVFALCVSLSCAIPVSKVGTLNEEDVSVLNNAIEQIILDLLEDLRDTMLNGSDDVPVLDPLYIEHIDLDLEEFGIPGIRLSVDDLTVKQLATFAVDSFTVNIGILPPQWRMSLDGHIPSLDIEADHYDVNIAILGLNFWGNGDARLSLVEPRIEGQLNVRIFVIGGFFVQVDSSDLRFHMSAFKSDIKGLLGDESANNFINAVLEIMIPDLISSFQEEIAEVLNIVIVEVANAILADLDLGDIFGRQNIPLFITPQQNSL